MQKKRERCEDTRFLRIESGSLVEFTGKVIVVSGFGVFDCPENMFKALLTEEEIVVAHHFPSFPTVRQRPNVVQLRFQGGNKLFAVEIVYKDGDNTGASSIAALQLIHVGKRQTFLGDESLVEQIIPQNLFARRYRHHFLTCIHQFVVAQSGASLDISVMRNPYL